MYKRYIVSREKQETDFYATEVLYCTHSYFFLPASDYFHKVVRNRQIMRPESTMCFSKQQGVR